MIDAQCAAVEDVLQLIRDQSVTMRDPRQLSDHLDTLVRDVEQTEETVRELEAFPAWARELSEKYYSRTISMFVLHGNVRDLVISYGRSGGLSFATPDMKADFDRAMAGCDSFAETIVPAGGNSSMPAEDRNSLVILKRWVQNPGVASLQIPLPDETERLDVIAAQPAPGSYVTPATLAKPSAGLKRVQLLSLIPDAFESGGLLEFVQSRFDLSMVAGQAAAKRKLLGAAQATRAGRTDVVPMGYVICGPVRAGKIGIPAVTSKNFRGIRPPGLAAPSRSSWMRPTPNWATAPAAATAVSATASSPRSPSFMGNTELRVKVIWFLLTCRPDLLPVDLKRQGRAEEHIALFHPDTDEERLAMLRAMQKKTGTQVSSPDVEQFFLNHATGLSGADVEAVLMRARMKSVLANEAAVDLEDVKAALVPNRDRVTNPSRGPRMHQQEPPPPSTATWTAAKSSAAPTTSRCDLPLFAEPGTISRAAASARRRTPSATRAAPPGGTALSSGSPPVFASTGPA